MATGRGSASHVGPWGWGANLRSFVRADAGGLAVYIALVTPLFIGAAGLAVDVASWYATKRTMQTGADAAAFAAALDIARQGLDQAPDHDLVQIAADDVASRNGLATPVTVNIPPTSGLAAGDPQSVEIIATQLAPLPSAGCS